MDNRTIPRSVVEQNLDKLKLQDVADGHFLLVFWEDSTLGVIQENNIVDYNETEKNSEGFVTGRAKYTQSQTFSVVYLVRGSDEEKLYKLAEKIDTDFRRFLKKNPVQGKRKPKRKILSDFEVEGDGESMEGSGDKGTSASAKQHKGDKTKKPKGNSQKKVGGERLDKEGVLEEKKKKEKSRAETLKHAESYILNLTHVSSQPNELTTQTSITNACNQHVGSKPPNPPSTGGSQQTIPLSTGGSQPTIPLSTGGSQSTIPPSTGGSQSTTPPLTGGSQSPIPPSTGGSQPTIPPSTGGSQPNFPPSTVGSKPTIPQSTGGSQPNFPPSSGGSQPTIPPSTEGSQPNLPPSTGGSQSTIPQSTGGSQPNFPPSTGGSQPNFPPSTGGSQPIIPLSTVGSKPTIPQSTGGSRPNFPPSPVFFQHTIPQSPVFFQPTDPRLTVTSTVTSQYGDSSTVTLPDATTKQGGHSSSQHQTHSSPSVSGSSSTRDYSPNSFLSPVHTQPSHGFPNRPFFNENDLHSPYSAFSRPSSSRYDAYMHASHALPCPSDPYPTQRPNYLSPHVSMTQNPDSQQAGSNLIRSSLNVLNQDSSNQFACPDCAIKDKEIESLSSAQSQALKDIHDLQARVKYLEAEIAKQDAAVSSGPQDSTEDTVKPHYTPSRGLQVELANYQIVPLTQDPPSNMERLAENEELCVPRNWLSCVLSKCKGKGAAFTFKKLIDGFFEPESLVNRKAVELASSNKIMRAIKMYTINKLRLKESQFHAELNSKLHSARRIMKKDRTSN